MFFLNFSDLEYRYAYAELSVSHKLIVIHIMKEISDK